MKGKSDITGSPYFQNTLQVQCWPLVRRKKQSILKRLLTQYQQEIDALWAATAVGFMFLLGIWEFLVQLAELN
ncbi:MAG: hypothetical protein U9R57_16160 [Thermodesulfobacteriota bacterium]|nr:hypothetical protein [Thermodesulfobacteriota bacterium]